MVDCTLCSMKLEGFRSIYSQHVEFDNPTFVVGPNGSGKSNFADAFAFLSEAMSSPLRAVIERRGGFSAVSYRGSAGPGPAELTLSVRLERPDSDTTRAFYTVCLHPRGCNDFEVALETCHTLRSDGSDEMFLRRNVDGPQGWQSSMEFLQPAVEPDALVLPLVGGVERFRPVLRFLSGMRIYRIDPKAVRAMQDPDGGTGLRSDGRNAASVLRDIERKSPAEDRMRVCELMGHEIHGWPPAVWTREG